MRNLAANFFALGEKPNWVNFQIYIQKSQWKIAFFPVFSPIFQDFCHFIHFCHFMGYLCSLVLVNGGKLAWNKVDPANVKRAKELLMWLLLDCSINIPYWLLGRIMKIWSEVVISCKACQKSGAQSISMASSWNFSIGLVESRINLMFLVDRVGPGVAFLSL